MIRVFRSDGSTRILIQAAEGNIQQKSINGVDICTINYRSPIRVGFGIGDYAVILNERYTLNTPTRENKRTKRDYEYTLNFEGQGYKLGRADYLFLDSQNRFTLSYFFLNVRPLEFLQLIVYNMQRMFPNEDWKIGKCIDAEPKNISFDGVNCLEAINTLAEQYETEFIVEEGNKVSLYKREAYNGLVLRFGAGEGLHDIVSEGQNQSSPITRLYAYGSNKNIGSNYRLGEPRLRMDGNRYVERFTNQMTEVYEKSIIFEDIYPHREGTISLSETPFTFVDSSMDFDLNDYLIAGVSPKIVFSSGLLNGYTFEVSNYDPVLKKFTILKNNDEQTIDIPSFDYYPVIGDTYTIVDVMMPDSYIIAAENQLKERAIQWLIDNGYPKIKYTVICNPFWIQKLSVVIKLGDVMTIDVPEMGIDIQIRVISISRDINKPYIYAVELADVANKNILVKLITAA